MVKITVVKKSARNGSGNLLAKGQGRQRTIKWDHSKSVDANFGAGAHALANVLLTPLQAAKVRHPSGAQRVRVEQPKSGTWVFNIDV